MVDSNETTELHQQHLRCSDLAKMLGSKHRSYRRQTMAKGSKNNMRLFCTKNLDDKEILYAAYCKKISNKCKIEELQEGQYMKLKKN